eukprot:1699146-Amphidinium_carterae.2
MSTTHHCQKTWYRELEDMVTDGQQDVQSSAQQDWEKHHRQGHLTKSPDCPTCQREAGTRVVHSRKDKAKRQTGMLHVDLADMGTGHSNKRYVLVMGATMTIDNKQVVKPFNSPLRSKDSRKVAELVAEVILWLRNSTHTAHLDGARIVRVMSGGGGEFVSDIIKSKLLELGVYQSFSPPHSPSPTDLQNGWWD